MILQTFKDITSFESLHLLSLYLIVTGLVGGYAFLWKFYISPEKERYNNKIDELELKIVELYQELLSNKQAQIDEVKEAQKKIEEYDNKIKRSLQNE